MKRVAIRADASQAIGTGHVVRTLTLAEDLRSRGVEVHFVTRNFPHGGAAAIAAAGFPASVLPVTPGFEETWLGASPAADADLTFTALHGLGSWDWIVVDHYALGEPWETTVAQAGAALFAIDDLADRPHACAALLDQNVQPAGRYDGLVPSGAARFIGPPYALVREQFRRARTRAALRERISRVLVFYGGFDATGETAKALRALREIEGDFTIEAIVPPAGPRRAEAEGEAARDPRVNVHSRVDRMAELMLSSDLCLGAAGTASWERCFVGLPAVVSAVAPNQEPVLEALAQTGAVVAVGRAEETSPAALAAVIRELAASGTRLRAMSERAYALCDGHEAAHGEVMDALLNRRR